MKTKLKACPKVAKPLKEVFKRVYFAVIANKGNKLVVLRDTRKEAEDYFHYIANENDFKILKMKLEETRMPLNRSKPSFKAHKRQSR